MKPQVLVPGEGARGFSLIELMIALIVLSVGILAVARLFPAGTRGQTQDRMQVTASYHATEEVERLAGLAWTDGELSLGSHPGGGTEVACGQNNRFFRSYEVSAMDAPLDDLKKVTVTVRWNNAAGRAVSLSTYVRR